MKNKNKESSTNKLRAKRAFAIALSGVALAGCSSKPKSDEASTTTRQKPAATEVQQKTSTTTAQQETTQAKTVEAKEFSGEVTGHPVDIDIIPKGNNDFEIRVFNPNDQAATPFGICAVGAIEDKKTHITTPIDAPAYDTHGLEVIKYEGGSMAMVPGLKTNESVAIDVDFPDNADGTLYVETFPVGADVDNMGQLQAQKHYRPGVNNNQPY